MTWLADHELEELDLLVEEAEDVRFDRSLRGEVDNVRLARLADAVNAPDALFNHHGIPRQLVVHEHVAQLEVESLGGRATKRRRMQLRSTSWRNL
jgi:hypothetical protein